MWAPPSASSAKISKLPKPALVVLATALTAEVNTANAERDELKDERDMLRRILQQLAPLNIDAFCVSYCVPEFDFPRGGAHRQDCAAVACALIAIEVKVSEKEAKEYADRDAHDLVPTRLAPFQLIRSHILTYLCRPPASSVSRSTRYRSTRNIGMINNQPTPTTTSLPSPTPLIITTKVAASPTTTETTRVPATTMAASTKIPPDERKNTSMAIPNNNNNNASTITYQNDKEDKRRGKEEEETENSYYGDVGRRSASVVRAAAAAAAATATANSTTQHFYTSSYSSSSTHQNEDKKEEDMYGDIGRRSASVVRAASASAAAQVGAHVEVPGGRCLLTSVVAACNGGGEAAPAGVVKSKIIKIDIDAFCAQYCIPDFDFPRGGNGRQDCAAVGCAMIGIKMNVSEKEARDNGDRDAHDIFPSRLAPFEELRTLILALLCRPPLSTSRYRHRRHHNHHNNHTTGPASTSYQPRQHEREREQEEEEEEEDDDFGDIGRRSASLSRTDNNQTENENHSSSSSVKTIDGETKTMIGGGGGSGGGGVVVGGTSFTTTTVSTTTTPVTVPSTMPAARSQQPQQQQQPPSLNISPQTCSIRGFLPSPPPLPALTIGVVEREEGGGTGDDRSTTTRGGEELDKRRSGGAADVNDVSKVINDAAETENSCYGDVGRRSASVVRAADAAAGSNKDNHQALKKTISSTSGATTFSSGLTYSFSATNGRMEKEEEKEATENNITTTAQKKNVYHEHEINEKSTSSSGPQHQHHHQHQHQNQHQQMQQMMTYSSTNLSFERDDVDEEGKAEVDGSDDGQEDGEGHQQHRRNIRIISSSGKQRSPSPINPSPPTVPLTAQPSHTSNHQSSPLLFTNKSNDNGNKITTTDNNTTTIRQQEQQQQQQQQQQHQSGDKDVLFNTTVSPGGLPLPPPSTSTPTSLSLPSSSQPAAAAAATGTEPAAKKATSTSLSLSFHEPNHSHPGSAAAPLAGLGTTQDSSSLAPLLGTQVASASAARSSCSHQAEMSSLGNYNDSPSPIGGGGSSSSQSSSSRQRQQPQSQESQQSRPSPTTKSKAFNGFAFREPMQLLKTDPITGDTVLKKTEKAFHLRCITTHPLYVRQPPDEPQNFCVEMDHWDEYRRAAALLRRPGGRGPSSSRDDGDGDCDDMRGGGGPGPGPNPAAAASWCGGGDDDGAAIEDGVPAPTYREIFEVPAATSKRGKYLDKVIRPLLMLAKIGATTVAVPTPAAAHSHSGNSNSNSPSNHLLLGRMISNENSAAAAPPSPADHYDDRGRSHDDSQHYQDPQHRFSPLQQNFHNPPPQQHLTLGGGDATFGPDGAAFSLGGNRGMRGGSGSGNGNNHHNHGQSFFSLSTERMNRSQQRSRYDLHLLDQQQQQQQQARRSAGGDMMMNMTSLFPFSTSSNSAAAAADGGGLGGGGISPLHKSSGRRITSVRRVPMLPPTESPRRGLARMVPPSARPTAQPAFPATPRSTTLRPPKNLKKRTLSTSSSAAAVHRCRSSVSLRQTPRCLPSGKSKSSTPGPGGLSLSSRGITPLRGGYEGGGGRAPLSSPIYDFDPMGGNRPDCAIVMCTLNAVYCELIEFLPDDVLAACLARLCAPPIVHSFRIPPYAPPPDGLPFYCRLRPTQASDLAQHLSTASWDGIVVPDCGADFPTVPWRLCPRVILHVELPIPREEDDHQQYGGAADINLNGTPPRSTNTTDTIDRTIPEGFLLGAANIEAVDLSPSTGITGIEGGFLKGCKNLSSVQLPSSVVSIGPHFLHSCPKLPEMDLRATRIATAPDAFMCGCEALTQLQLPDTVTELGDYFMTFSAVVSRLKRLDLGACTRITKIGERFLFECATLAHLILPSTVNEVGDRFLQKCTALTPDNVETESETIRATLAVNEEATRAAANANVTQF